ncbi:nickel-dependent hydrogenase large subunit [Deltaproteobacteria bacterium TL4]
MGYNKIIIDPVTRIEGHLKIEAEIQDNVVVGVKASSEMFRGIEKALIGYDARVAQQVTQRVCGICPYAHAEAASLALENAMGIKPNSNGQLLRNLIVGAYQLSDNLLHFYYLCALDFIDIAAVLQYQGKDATLVYLRNWVKAELESNSVFPASPFLPRYEGDYNKDSASNFSAIKHYAEALPVMADIHKMVALFGGKAPHPVTMEAGGVTTIPTPLKLARFQSFLEQAEAFITQAYYNDVVAVASQFRRYFQIGRGNGNLLSYPFMPDANGETPMIQGGVSIQGVYEPLDPDKISEDHTYSYYNDKPSSDVRPLAQNKLTPLDEAAFEKEQQREGGKYSWTKAPRYNGHVMQVGPAARLINTYRSGKNPRLTQLLDQTNRQLGISLDDYDSVMGRHLSRMLTSLLMIEKLKEDLAAVRPDQKAFVEMDVPKSRRGVGLTEASRGALGHWLETDEKGYIRNYDLIVPTTWNLSPKDSQGKRGFVEQMLIGTKVANSQHPLELLRIIRSVDPCMACSVH